MASFKRYELVERIGIGGMAEVYRANGVAADGSVVPLVIKKILPTLSGDKRFQDMFVDEARITAHLAHPNVVRLLDMGRMDDQLFLALELVEGVDLQRLLATLEGQRKKLPFADAVYIICKVLEGLEYAHERTLPDGKRMAIVHRDVSPGNILLARDGTVKLTDFGIAKGSVRDGQTMVGAIKGNLRYIAPEQITGGVVGPWSDNYSTGMVLFRMIVGRYPIDFDALGTLVGMVVDGSFPRPYELDAGIPAMLDEIVRKAIEKEPASRYGRARDFREALERWAREARLVLGPPGIAAAVQIQMGLEAKAVEKAATRTKVVSVAEKQPEASDGSAVYKSVSLQPASSPFQPEVVDADVEEVTRKSFVRRPRPTGEITMDHTTTDEVRPPFARGLGDTDSGDFVIPDDLEVLKSVESALPVARETTRARRGDTLIEARSPGPVTGGFDEEETTRPTAIPVSPLVAPPTQPEDQSRSTSREVPNLAKGDDDARRGWEPDLDALGESADLPAEKSPLAPTTSSFNIPVVATPPAPSVAPPPPASSDDEEETTRATVVPAKRAAPVTSPPIENTTTVESPVAAPATKAPSPHARGPSLPPPRAAATMAIGGFMGHKDTVSSIAIAPSSRFVATGSHDQTVRIWDPATRREVRLLAGHAAAVTAISISPDGRQLASASRDKTVRVWDPISGKEAFVLAGHTDWIFSVAWSHDGKRLVSSSADRTVRVWDVAERREILCCEGHRGIVTQVRFLPSWQRQVISTGYDATVRIWSLGGGGEVRSLGTPSMEAVRALAVSPEGEYAFSGGADSQVRVWDLATGSVDVLSGHTGPVVALASPDGNTLGSGSHDGTIKIWDVSARREMKTLRGHRGSVMALCFSPDGRYLLSGGDDRIVAIWQLGL